MMRIVFPEYNNPITQEALAIFKDPTRPVTGPRFVKPEDITAVPAKTLDEACHMLTKKSADAMIVGLDYTSRDVILACREHLGMATNPHTDQTYDTFSGMAVMQRDEARYILADMAACKHPTKEQLVEIVWQTYTSALKLLSDQPRIALLSFSTFGSGGDDPTITLMRDVLAEFKDSGLMIDGEMQLDAAINPMIGYKKAPSSLVAGQANVLIAPDLNSGNLIYKTFEQIAAFTVAGPILQGFNYPVSDLSRGSTAADVALTIETMAQLSQ